MLRFDDMERIISHPRDLVTRRGCRVKIKTQCYKLLGGNERKKKKDEPQLCVAGWVIVEKGSHGKLNLDRNRLYKVVEE